MKLFAIGDLHLPGGDDKPMDVFGPQWDHHFERISRDWLKKVSPEDTVLIPGDISWAMQLEQAVPDLQAIAALPGKKILLRGNHDYWWSSLTRVRSILPENMRVIQNDAAESDLAVICGTRGWTLPGQEEEFSANDRKILNREAARLELSLQAAAKLSEKCGKPIVLMMHYPPIYRNGQDTEFTDVIDRYPVSQVVYGHLHGIGITAAFNGIRKGVPYRLTSCDSLGFALEELPVSATF